MPEWVVSIQAAQPSQKLMDTGWGSEPTLTNKGRFQLFEKEAAEGTHQHSGTALQAHTCHTSRWKHRPVWQQLVVRGGDGFDGIVVEWCGAGHGILGHLRHHQRKGVLGGRWIWRGSKRHVGVHGARGWLVAGWCGRTTPGPRRERTCKQERAQLSTARRAACSHQIALFPPYSGSHQRMLPNSWQLLRTLRRLTRHNCDGLPLQTARDFPTQAHLFLSASQSMS